MIGPATLPVRRKTRPPPPLHGSAVFTAEGRSPEAAGQQLVADPDDSPNSEIQVDPQAAASTVRPQGVSSDESGGTVPRAAYMRLCSQHRVDTAAFLREINVLLLHVQRQEVALRAAATQAAAGGTSTVVRTRTTAPSPSSPSASASPTFSQNFAKERAKWTASESADHASQPAARSPTAASAAACMMLPAPAVMPQLGQITSALSALSIHDLIEEGFADRICIERDSYECRLTELQHQFDSSVRELERRLADAERSNGFVRASLHVSIDVARQEERTRLNAVLEERAEAVALLEKRLREQQAVTEGVRKQLADSESQQRSLGQQLVSARHQLQDLMHEKAEVRAAIGAVVGRVATARQAALLCQTAPVQQLLGREASAAFLVETMPSPPASTGGMQLISPEKRISTSPAVRPDDDGNRVDPTPTDLTVAPRRPSATGVNASPRKYSLTSSRPTTVGFADLSPF